MNYEAVALGELLIDFVQVGERDGMPVFAANPGGAPCNVLAMLRRLGHSCAFLGKVGADAFGKQLRAAIRAQGIGDEGLISDPEAKTTLAVVHNDEKGERSFSFYRNPGADMLLRREELPCNVIEQARVFHFGSLSLTHPCSAEATWEGVKRAKCISFDPNLRPLLWGDLEQAKREISRGMAACDVAKVAENELEFLTGERDVLKGAELLRRQFPNVRLLTVTAGEWGSYAFFDEAAAYVPAFLQEKTVDTTGAGDCFFGCVLHFVLQHGLEAWSKDRLEAMLQFANAAAGLLVTRKGAMAAMPTMEELYAVNREW